MKHYLLLLFGLSVSFCSEINAHNIDTLFINTPRHIMPLLDKTSKMDLIDLYNEGLKAKVVNIYGGDTFLLKKTDKFLSLQTTKSGIWTMKILSCDNNSQLILCLHTVDAKGMSTNITAYSLDWNLKKIQIPLFSPIDFFKNPQSYIPSSKQTIISSFKYLPIEAHVCDSTDLIRFKLSPQGLIPEFMDSFTESINSICLRWDGSAFVRED